MFKEIPLKEMPVFIDLKGKQKELFPQFKAVAESQNTQLTGVIAEDQLQNGSFAVSCQKIRITILQTG
ncbi:hypothetical protein KEH51_09575 [[Brevibacterium] frigoritolerans]|uniref:Uncharacterized protein n=1 Tax=Peribacillus frigoritolerans TaxID=450367 RepID=A0A941FKW3_9BACI|nr:hypothetical protein [Peribacillus frigoritolerans]